MESFFKINWGVKVEEPTDKIYDFNGIFFQNSSKEVLRLNNTVWANMKVASGEILGFVIYIGKETRLSLNSKNPTSKYGKTDQDINKLSKLLFLVLFIITVIFLFLSGQIFANTKFRFLVINLVLFSSIIPISMKVNVDFAKLYYTNFINNNMKVQGIIARNSSIPEELGRVQYLLSDKTGTLTKNQMIFKHL